MKQIGNLLKVQNESKKSSTSQGAWGWLEVKKTEIVAKYGDANSFALKFNPSVQMKCAMNIEKALTGDAPTIKQLLYTYKIEQLQVWLMAQIEDLNSYAGVKSKMTTRQMRELAGIIIINTGYLKASEILLFFYKLKAGDFGGFYGTVDPQKVGEYLIAFKSWRRQELDRVHHKHMLKERERKRRAWQQTAITREEYNKLRDKDAKTHPPH